MKSRSYPKYWCDAGCQKREVEYIGNRKQDGNYRCTRCGKTYRRTELYPRR